MKVSELQGAELDYWVAKADGVQLMPQMPPRMADCWDRDECDWCTYSPSTEWMQGGPIIERDRISVLAQVTMYSGVAINRVDRTWEAEVGDQPRVAGPTPLIAAMRAYVARKFGPEVSDTPANKEEE